jgi:carboxymethylenebutenolidase
MSPALTAEQMVALWKEHTDLEFATRDAPATVATMARHNSVNHVPVMTGGRGADGLLQFYGTHFIPKMPADASLRLLARTVGTDRLVDEFVFAFTHDLVMDWMLPGVPPTHRRVEIPMVAVVTFEQGKLACERIYWDQASVLVQVGLLDRGTLPVTGIEQARKFEDDTLPSNTLIDAARKTGTGQ